MLFFRSPSASRLALFLFEPFLWIYAQKAVCLQQLIAITTCMRLENRVESFIVQHHLLTHGARVLVALSGGADSVALLRMLMNMGYVCHAVHCNFHLRGEESHRDECFVTHLCSSFDVPLVVLHFDTKAYAAEHHLSIEMAARELRYREFERIRQSEGLEAIAVAHHRDDAVETLLLNLIRGAGIHGLTGMHARNGAVVRPLLCVSRDEVLDYLKRLGQDYVTDSTNLTDKYARNKVRLGLIPLMQEINPRAVENIAQAATNLSDAAVLYNVAIAERCAHIVTPHPDGIDIDIESLLAAEVPHTLLFEILYPYGFNARQVADVFRSLSGKECGVGRMFYAGGYSLLVDRAHLLLRRHSSDGVGDMYMLPEEGRLELPDGIVLKVERVRPDERWSVPRTNEVCVMDVSSMHYPLKVRHPGEGDRMRPFGMRGTKLLSDLYTDAKLSRIDRQGQWVLCHGDDIVWAVGVRTSELCRLRGDEHEVVLISLMRS